VKPIKAKILWIAVSILIVGLYIGDQVFLQKRGIATVTGAVTETLHKSYYDLTEIPDSEFNRAYKTALVSGVEVEKTSHTLGISWGQFMIKNESGGKVYACDKYPSMEVELKAEGVAYSGELPVLRVRGPCRTSDDGKKILSMPIPLSDLAKLQVDAELKVPLDPRGEDFTVSVKNFYKPMARFWNVTNVKIYNENESLSVDGYEIISLLDQALTLDFAVTQ
jgi:hypothetical protein